MRADRLVCTLFRSWDGGPNSPFVLLDVKLFQAFELGATCLHALDPLGLHPDQPKVEEWRRRFATRSWGSFSKAALEACGPCRFGVSATPPHL